ncbi:hypothetical protein JST97_34940 [bacterium]|nr:hypothetical protein [bacterium]
MSIFRPLINSRMRPALVLSLLALSVLSWVLLQTPHRSPETAATPLAGQDQSGRLREQNQARQQRKDYLAAQHKEYTLGSRSGGDTCDYNLIHLGGALEAYRADHTTYPKNLAELVPGYIDHLPTCPNAGKETYSTGYSVSQYGYKCDLKCNHKHEGMYSIKPPHYESIKGIVYPGGVEGEP